MIQFFLPCRLQNLTNTRGHWSVRHRYSRQLRALTAALGKEASRDVELHPDEPKHIKFIAYVRRRFDEDGLQAAVKPIRDGLQIPAPALVKNGRVVRQAQVGCGIIHSDGIRSGHQFEYQQETIKRGTGQGGVFVVIESVR